MKTKLLTLTAVASFFLVTVSMGQSISSSCLGNTGSPNTYPYPSAMDGGYIPLGVFGAQNVFSISMWINPGVTQYGISILMDASHGSSLNWVIQTLNGGATWTWGNGVFSLTPNVWQHLLLTYDNGNRKIFVDGSVVQSYFELITYSGSPSLYLGNWPEGGRRFNGLIDDLYITTDVLHSSNFVPPTSVSTTSPSTFGLWQFNEGTGLTTNNSTATSFPLNNWYWTTRNSTVPCSVPAYVPTNGLVGYWPFCGNANDVSGNGNNGTVNGATLTTDRNGTLNEAFDFDGTSDFISIGSLNNISNFSIAFWFKRNNDLNLSYPIGLGINNSNTVDVYKGYGIGIAPNSASACGIAANDIKANDGLSTCANIVGNSTSILNTWEHIVLTSNGSSASLFYNGTLSQFNNSIFIPGILDLVVGMRSDNFAPFPGSIDDIGIWNRALSALEIQQLYNSTPCTKPEPVTLGTDRSTKLCPNEAVTIEIVTPSTAGLSYEWTRNGTTMPGATASSITVADAAKYKVFVRSGPGLDCQRVSGLIETTAAIPPTITATTPNGNAYCPGDSVLMSATGITPGYSYQWKRFGVPIAGATSANFYAKQTGNYRCEVTNAGGCINQSNLVSIVNGTSCRIMQGQSSDVNVYPNPAKNSFTVSFNDIGNETPVSIELRNLQGQIIENRKLNGLGDVQFNVNKLSPGMYMVRVMLESGDVVEKNVMVE
jgi:hypothetical protein